MKIILEKLKEKLLEIKKGYTEIPTPHLLNMYKVHKSYFILTAKLEAYSEVISMLEEELKNEKQ